MLDCNKRAQGKISSILRNLAIGSSLDIIKITLEYRDYCSAAGLLDDGVSRCNELISSRLPRIAPSRSIERLIDYRRINPFEVTVPRK